MVEVASAIARRTREGTLAASTCDDVYRAFLADTVEYQMLGVTEAITSQAASLLLTTPDNLRIRSLDALHVASAQLTFARAQQQGIDVGRFVTADRALLEAAMWAGLEVENPERY